MSPVSAPISSKELRRGMRAENRPPFLIPLQAQSAEATGTLISTARPKTLYFRPSFSGA